MSRSAYNLNSRIALIMQQFIEFITNHWILSSSWIFIAAMLVSSWMRSASKNPSVNSQQATDLINRQDAVVVDIRGNGEFKNGHVINSINIPMSDLTNNASALEKHKNNPIIVVCNTGMQASVAANQLKTAGFEQVYRLAGGIQAWKADSMPIATK